MARTDYVAATVRLRAEVKELAGVDLVDFISRPGGGDPPRWHFVGGYIARGGHAAEAYLQGVLATLKSREGSDASLR